MKRTIAQFLFASALISATLVSCKKKEDTTPTATTTPTPTTTSTANGFTWQENGGAVITADSAYWVTGGWGTGIRAFKGGMANYFEMNWATQNNTAVGAKTVSSSGGFTFLKASDTYINSTAQTVNITAFASNKLSGNFNVAVTGGGSITTLSGSFGNLSLK